MVAPSVRYARPSVPHKMAEGYTECIRDEEEVIETWRLHRELDPHDRHPRDPGRLGEPLLAYLPSLACLADAQADRATPPEQVI